MGILGSLANVFSGGIAGGITGVIGTVASAFANYKLKRLEYEHEEKMAQLQMEADRLRGELAQSVAEAKSKAQIDLAEVEAWKESYKDLGKTYFDKSYFQFLPNWSKPIVGILFATLDFIRGSIRPFITFYILLAASWIVYKTYIINPNAFAASADKIVNMILYLSTTVITWYYGVRQVDKHIEEFNKKRGISKNQ